VQGVDDCLDAVIGPLNVAAEYVDRISKGDIPQKISDTYHGDFNEIKNNLNMCIDAVNALVTDADKLSKAAVDGKLATRADASKHQGDFRKIVQGVDDCLDAVIGPLNVAAEYIERISKGDIPNKITDSYNGDFNEIKNSLNKCIEAVNAMVADADVLSKAAVEGKLATRADASKHSGDFRKIVQGVNETLDAVIGPLNVAAKYVDDISKGVIPPAITDNYNGDFNVIKNNLNSVVKMMADLLKETDVIIKAAADGELDKRANAELFVGGWKQLISGINDTITNIVNPLMVTADYVEKVSKGIVPPEISTTYKGQYNLIKQNLNAVVKMMENLLKETDTLINAAITGSLSTRANAGLFIGGWNQLVAGINKTLDSVLEPITEAAGVLDKVAARDLTARVVGDYKGDHAKIKNSLNLAVENLDKALQQVSEATEQVTSASQQISSGSQSLAQGANEQASSLEEVSSSLEEMASMTKQNADNAIQAKNLSGEADQNAKTGAEAMIRMSNTINKIKESSDQTAKIVKTIDEIAMQTNLLALNAAVEAARAGEAGRGFAVVAEEVRNLAQRSAQAAKNTADMISESVKNADDGVKIAGEVSVSFTTIATSANKVNDLIAEIAAASQEQTQGIDQVNSAVAQMDKVTQQNAANSEESASAAEELSSQAEELKTMIDQFALSYVASQQRSFSASRSEVKRHEITSVKQPQKSEVNSSKKVLKKVNKKDDFLGMDDSSLKDF
jgi:methyl-accepting chemotaxis protein